jgi:hypothetical protein
MRVRFPSPAPPVQRSFRTVHVFFPGIGFAFVVTAGATLVADIAGHGKLATSASY